MSAYLIQKIISENDINTSRQYEFDIAKGFAIIFMVICHVFMACARSSHSTLYLIVSNILGGPLAAPVFMTCMGIGICFSRNSSPKKLFLRGLNLLAIGYILNIFRICVPYIVASVIQNSFDIKLLVLTFIGMDILQFAGLAFMFISLLKKININSLGLFCTIFICALIGTIYPHIEPQINSYVIPQIIGMFLPTKSLILSGEDIAFPFFNWIIFPLFGLYFGNLIKKVLNKNIFYPMLLVLTSILTIVYIMLNIKYGVFYMAGGSYYHIDLISALFYLAIVLCAFSIYYFLLNILSENIKNILYTLSKHINSVYCIHWVILGWCGYLPFVFLKFNPPNEYLLLLWAFILVYVSMVLAVFWSDKLKPCLIQLIAK